MVTLHTQASPFLSYSIAFVLKSGISSFDVFRQRGKALLAYPTPSQEPPGS